VTAATAVVNGDILADGGTPGSTVGSGHCQGFGGASGGSIWLTADTLSGTGLLTAHGGEGGEISDIPTANNGTMLAEQGMGVQFSRG
jgi:hypothetical protein